MEEPVGFAWKRSLASCFVPIVRAYIRYAPFESPKRLFWERVVNPYFAWQPHEFVATTIFGSRIAGRTTDIIQQYVYYFGFWEPQLTSWIREQLAPGDTFVDVGANIGYFSLLASRLVGESGAVVAIEASPAIFVALQRNLQMNLTGNVRAVNIAAADAHRTLPLYHGPDSNIGQSTLSDEEGFVLAGTVDAAPLDGILTPKEIRTVRVIKMDIEGAEGMVVSTMGPLLAAARNDLEVIVEVHPELLRRQNREPSDIFGFFQRAGFHAYSLETDYSPRSYLSPDLGKRPQRIRTAVENESDVVFSRRDVEFL